MTRRKPTRGKIRGTPVKIGLGKMTKHGPGSYSISIDFEQFMFPIDGGGESAPKPVPTRKSATRPPPRASASAPRACNGTRARGS